MTTIVKIWFILKINIFKILIATNIMFFDAFVLLASIPSEISILSRSSIYMLLTTHTTSLLNKVSDKIYHFFHKIHLPIIVNICNFNGLFNGKLSCVLHLIFVKSLPYSPFFPLFIVSISFLIPSQSSVVF